MGVKTDQGREQRRRLLTFLRAYWKAYGYMPTIAEMAQELETTPTPVIWHLRSMRDQGYVTFVDGRVTPTLRVVPSRRVTSLL